LQNRGRRGVVYGEKERGKKKKERFRSKNNFLSFKKFVSRELTCQNQTSIQRLIFRE